jgi:nucleolysin TIA-1/TIAR
MADNGPPTAPGQLPPPPQPNAGAPGYDQNGQNAGQNPSHMPPPPLHIPQNTNPIPTAITSPMGAGGDKSGMMSPGSAGPFGRRAAPEPNKRALYVGGLDPRVTEDVLRQIFETTGHVQSVKIIPDKNVSGDLTDPDNTGMEIGRTIVGYFSIFPFYSTPPRLAADRHGLI